MTIRERARDMWEFPGSTMKLCEIAETLQVPATTVRSWKSRYGWDGSERDGKHKRRRGGQPGNKNAVGAGAPLGNINAVVTGAYTWRARTV
jgi:uncharacterized protein YjcR